MKPSKGGEMTTPEQGMRGRIEAICSRMCDRVLIGVTHQISPSVVRHNDMPIAVEAILTEIVKMCEGMKKYEHGKFYIGDGENIECNCNQCNTNQKYNQAITDIINNLKRGEK